MFKHFLALLGISAHSQIFQHFRATISTFNPF